MYLAILMLIVNGLGLAVLHSMLVGTLQLEPTHQSLYLRLRRLDILATGTLILLILVQPMLQVLV